MTQIKAVVFDMDGVLIDSEQYYQDRLMAYFRAMEVDSPPQRLNLLVGANGKMNLWPKILEGITLPQPYDEFMVGLREYRHAQGIEDYRPLLFPGVEETLKQLKARGKKLALASSSSFASIEKMLSDTGLYAYFELVTSGGMFKESKPNPEIYLFTAKKLKLEPHQCLVVEDSQYGIQAGVSAGMTVIARQDERFPMDQSQAHYFVKQLQEVPAIVDQLER